MDWNPACSLSVDEVEDVDIGALEVLLLVRAGRLDVLSRRDLLSCVA